MDKNYSIIAQEKSKEELINILINKEEFKDELVKAAELELKRRQKEGGLENPDTTSSIHSHTPIIVNSNTRKPEAGIGIYFAGIGYFLIGLSWLFIGSALTTAGAVFNSGQASAIGIWNVLIAILCLVFGIGIITGKKWGYDWGLGTAFLNAAIFGYYYLAYGGSYAALSGALDVAIIIALFSNKKFFYPPPSTQELKQILNSQSENEGLNKSEEDLCIELYKMIHDDSYNLGGLDQKSAVIKQMQIICTTKERCANLLNNYSKISNVDLVQDLNSLSSQYAKIKEFNQPLIDLGFVERKYPHNRKSS